ncbi:uncharacterized protein KGF55_002470 [Candida pseudojiufengensis]|uniref:uncharacterized protein n=1 Tax=Candida pseudojiufengensis TaxID=497109 RepID=UPI002224DB73|nr:uncharacterized protein KGF55_002470 [Candida pseudojiufengensis]KAI5963590.1 hypothetical protein KGF55_002470 [Candida pseudojiufengensis]
MTEVRYKHYSSLNYIAFNYAGFACISIVVFLTATQPFYIKEVIGIEPRPGNIKDTKIGHIIGGLGFFDELISMISAPLLGTLNDKLNTLGFGGSKLIQSSSLLILAIALFGYGVINSHLIPDMFIFRGIFALGVTGCMSMVTVILNELSYSDFTLKKLLFWKKNDYEAINLNNNSQVDLKKNGKYSAIMGIATGLGAIFSVSAFVTLPVRFQDWNPDIDMKWSLKYSYLVVMGFAIFSAIFLYIFLYKPDSKVLQEETREENKPYFHILKDGFEFSKSNKQAQLAYVGAFVARSTTVATSLFIPLMVYDWYYNIGECENGSGDWAGKMTCYEGYIFSAILTGVAQTVALISAPLWGYLVDNSKVGKYRTLAISGSIGALGNFGISLVNTNFRHYDPKTIVCFLFVSIIGFSQIGLIISSMSILSGISNVHQIMGSLSGFYSFCGGIGIMIITLVGGYLADFWILGPFFLLGLFNLILLGVYYTFVRETTKSISIGEEIEAEDNDQTV